MGEKIKRFFKWDINEKVVAILAVLAFAALMIPLIRLAFYATPWYDDYSYGRFVKAFLCQEYSLSSALEGVWYVVKTQYYAWQGTFSSIFFMALVPSVWGDQYYFAGILMILFFFVFATMTLVKVVCKNVLKADLSAQVIMMVVITTALLELIHTSQQGLFWYNAAVHYTFMHGWMFVLLAIAVKILYSNKLIAQILWMLLASFVGILCGGSNYVTSLQGILFLLTIIFLGVISKNKRTLWLVLPTVVYAVALVISMTAPGNEKRGQWYQGYGAIKSILYSFKSAALHFFDFTDAMMVVLLLLAIPVILSIVRKTEFKFRMPGLVTLYSVCMYATGFTSSYYGMGTEGVSRTWVAIKFTLQILLFINELYRLGWIAQKLEKKGKVFAQGRHYWLHYAGIAAGVLICFFFLEPNQVGTYSSYGAYYYIHTGEAGEYYNEYERRIEAIESGGDVAVLEPYYYRPWMICKGELSADPNTDYNKVMADWYGKQAIYIQE